MAAKAVQLQNNALKVFQVPPFPFFSFRIHDRGLEPGCGPEFCGSFLIFYTLSLEGFGKESCLDCDILICFLGKRANTEMNFSWFNI